ncbi:MAG: NAD-dependent epimerase/dehydratase family protein [archaeon]
MKKILITGATGFIGTKLVPKLLNEYKVVCFVRKTSDISKFKDDKLEFRYGDILDKTSLINATKNIDVVVHLATSHKQGKEDLNFIGSKNLLEACQSNKIDKLIFISSMATKRKILDDYGKTKLKIENLIKGSKINYIILRPSIIYSENNLSLIGKTLMEMPFIIPIIGNGKYKMSPVYIDDVTEAIFRSIKNDKLINRDYDVAGSENINFNEIIDICKKRFNIKKIIVHIPIFICLFVFRLFPIVSLESVKGINQDSNVSISELRKDLKLNPISFREGIKNVSL